MWDLKEAQMLNFYALCEFCMYHRSGPWTPTKQKTLLSSNAQSLNWGLWQLIWVFNLTQFKDTQKFGKAHFWVCLWRRMQRQLGYGSGNIGNTHPECGQQSPIRWGSGWNNKAEEGRFHAVHAKFLSSRCVLLLLPLPMDIIFQTLKPLNKNVYHWHSKELPDLQT